MIKNIEWAKNRIKNTLKFEAINDREVGFKIAMQEALEILNQLDEPEVLSQEWIDRHTYYEDEYDFYYADPDELKNLLVPKQDVPVVPTWFDEWWKGVTKGGGSLFHNIERFYDEVFSSGMRTRETYNYINVPDNKKKLLNIIVNELEYEVEEQQKYYARIKGWELFVDFVGAKYWGVVSNSGRLGFVSIDGAKERTKEEWNELGINEDNADFVKVEEEE